jgi:hypothetical protein
MSIRIRLVFLSIAMIYLYVTYTYRWTGEKGDSYKTIIASDGKGHYDYLPYFFVDGYGANREFDNSIHIHYKNKFVNKYYAGTAISQLPFFTVAYLYCKISGDPLTGFSAPFQLAVSLSGLFYFFFALYFLHKILVQHFKFSSGTSALTLLVFSFGSTILYYTVMLPSFSHVYTFFWMAFFFWNVSKISRGQYSQLIFMYCLFALSMVFVIRPVNIIVVLFIPVFFDSWTGMKTCFKSNFRFNRSHILIASVIALLPILVQCLAWYAQTGSFIIWSYKHEGFNWTNPQFGNFLFSYRKGLFIYTPLLLIAFCGLFSMLKSNRWKFAWTAVSLFVIVYVLCSWWCWHYAGGFGMRPMTDFLIIFILLYAYLVQHLKSVVAKVGLSLIVALAIFLNLIFSYQFYTDVLNSFSMNKEKFWSVFLKTNKQYRDCFGGMNDEQPYAPHGFDTLLIKKFTFDDKPNGMLNTSGLEFPCELVAGFQGQNYNSHYFKITLKRKVEKMNDYGEISIGIRAYNFLSDKSSYEQSIRVMESKFEKPGWTNSIYTVSCFNEEIKNKEIWIFFFNPKKERMLMDDIKVEVYAAKTQ